MRAATLFACAIAASALPARQSFHPGSLDKVDSAGAERSQDLKPEAKAEKRELQTVSYVNLTMGSPYLDSVYSPPGSPAYLNYVYFIYWYVQSPGVNGFRIRVSTLSDSKDVDVVANDWRNPTPTMTNANFTSATDFIEIIDVFPPSCPSPPGSPCPYYIGVTGYTWGQHAFTIEITLPASPTVLYDGQSSNGYVSLNDYSYYAFQPWTPTSTTQAVTISLDAYTGNPDIYVALNGAMPPSKTNYQYSVAGYTGSNMLVMSVADPIFTSKCPVGQPCGIAIAVFGYDPSVFLITVSTNTAIVNLTDGIPMARTVAAGAWAYFAYAPTYANNVTLALTVTNGDPDMYVSTSNPYPTAAPGGSTWQAATAGDEIITIATNDPNYLGPPGAVYYIGVFGYMGVNASFTLMASTAGAGQAVMLADGQAQSGQANPHTMALYSYNVTRPMVGQAPPSLDIFAVPQAGDVDLYVSNLVDPLGNTIYPKVTCGPINPSTGGCTYQVDPATYTWSSTGSGIQDLVSLSSSQITPGQQLGVGVLATTPDGPPGTAGPPPSVFSVTASSSNGIIQLQTGVPVPGIVSPRQIKYYKLTLSVYGADIVISADVRGGQLDMYAAETSIIPFPTPGSNTYNTSQGGGILQAKVLIIPFSTLSSPCVQALMYDNFECSITIAVRGWPGMGVGVESVYTISAAATGSPLAPTLIPDGASQYLYIPAWGAEYLYAFAAAPPGGSIYIVVQDLLPGSVSQLYLNLGPSGKGFWTPSGTVPADWVSVDAGGYERIIMRPNTTSAVPPTSGSSSGKTLRSGAPLQASSSPADVTITLGKDAVTGLVTVQGGAEEQARVAGGAKVVEHLPDGRTLLEVRLPSPFGDTIGNADPKTGLVQEIPAMSMLAQRMGLGPWAESAYVQGMLSRPESPEGEEEMAAARATIQAMQEAKKREGVSLGADPGNAPPYCNPCELFITVTSVGPYDTYAMVDFHTGNRVMPLSDGVPEYGDASPTAQPSYFSFTVTDPLADFMLTFSRIFGSTNAYIIVQSPSTPWLLPSPVPGGSTWNFSSSAFTPSFNISHTDPKACVPADGTRAGAPCTYLIAVTPRYNVSAAYTLTATAATAPLPLLIDGQPTNGQVQEGNVQYYQFQAAAPGYPAPAVILAWTNLLGSVQAYVTNQYTPGSQASLLPGPTSAACQWVCTNYSGCFMSPGDPCYAPRNSDGTPVIYTIAIVGFTGIVPFTSSYVLTATIAGDSSRVQIGIPTTDIFVLPRMNLNFTFELPVGGGDLLITASVNSGDVVMLVAHDDPTNFVIPSCTPPAHGSIIACNGYTWMASGVGEMVMYIPAADPCHPILPPGTTGITTGNDCGPTGQGPRSFRPGRFWVVLYGMSFSELSLMVNVMSGPVPRSLLADGQPQDTMTGPLTVCPGGSRDPVTFACNNPSVQQYTVQGSLFIFRVPSTVDVGDMYVQVERLCGGNTTGACGAPLVVAGNACIEGSCQGTDLVPYLNDAAVSYQMPDVIGGVWVPFGACYGIRVGTADCVYAIGVYPSGSDPNHPGLGTDPSLFRVTLATPVGIQRVSSDCYANGAVCSLPEHVVASGGSRRYEAYAGTFTDPQPVTLKATLCSGDPLSLSIYVCADGGNCGQINEPGPSNSDYIARSNTKGQAAVTFGQGTDVFFIGVSAAGKAGLPFPTYQLTIQSGNGPMLTLDPSDPNVALYRDATLTTVTLSWVNPQLKWNMPGTPPVLAANVQYTVALFPVGSTGQCQLNNVCGVGDALYNQIPGTIVSKGITGTSAVVTGLNPSIPYTVAVVAYCPAKVCMLYNEQGQSIAFPVTQSDPTPPAASPSPSPGSNPSNGPALHPATGPIIGGILGALVVAGAGFFAYRRFSSGGSGSNPYMRQGDGGGSSWFPSFGARSGGAYAYVPQSDSLLDALGGGGSGYVPPQSVDSNGMGQAYSAL